jgi:predicted ATP-dependent endonuclease of OLD family
VIIIDEPELHLHPSWQRMLINVLLSICNTFDNQLIVSTHSPTFANIDTISGVIRVYMKARCSTIASVNAQQLPQSRRSLAVLNSHNNERLFFCDAVVFVEGASDRVVFSYLIQKRLRQLESTLTIEVIEVNGKANFARYEFLTSAVALQRFCIGDLDNLSDLGDSAVKELCSFDRSLVMRTLRDKKSKDRMALIEAIERAVSDENLTPLKEIWSHVKRRTICLPKNLSTQQKAVIRANIARLRRDRRFILRFGEIEDYFQPQRRSLDDLIEMSAEGKLEEFTLNKRCLAELVGISRRVVREVECFVSREQPAESATT